MKARDQAFTGDLSRHNVVRWCASFLGGIASCVVAAGVLAADNAPDNGKPEKVEASVRAPELSPWSKEVLKLVQAGVEDETVAAYIYGTPGTFNLAAEHVGQLATAGAGSGLIQAMIQHDVDIGNGAFPLVASTVPGDAQVASRVREHVETPVVTRKDVVRPLAQPKDREASTIVHRVEPPEDGLQLESTILADFLADGPADDEPLVASASKYRVREPYPVRLTSTIVVLRMSGGRQPNTVILQPLD